MRPLYQVQAILLIAVICSCQQQAEHTQQQPVYGQAAHEQQQFAKNLNEDLNTEMQHEEIEADQQQIHKHEQQTSDWVAAEMVQIQSVNELKSHEIFAFVVEQEKEVQFKWDPTQTHSGPLSFVVEVFDYSSGYVTFPENPAEDNFIEVSTWDNNRNRKANLGAVYIKKLFKIEFFKDYQILLFNNKYGRTLMVQIGLEATNFVPPTALTDDKLKISAEKIGSILEELRQNEKLREKTFRQEYNFSDRQKHHQSQMLILTGVELFVIIATALVQMYCIKSLLENKSVI